MYQSNGPISGEIENLKSLGSQKLMKSQQQYPDLFKAIALQQMASTGQAGGRQQDMNPQPPVPGGNLVQQFEKQLQSQAMPQSPIARVAPGVMQQGQRSMQQARPQMAQGISANPAQNMQSIGRAQGGIIGFSQGGMNGVPQGMSNTEAQAQRPAATSNPQQDPEVIKFIQDMKKAQQDLDNAFPQEKQLFEQKIKDLIQLTSPRVKRIVSDMGTAKLAMGGDVRGYASGGEIRAYLSSIGRDIADFTEGQLSAISQMLDSQVARGQNSTLRGVARGAVDVLRDRMPSMPENAGATSDAARDFNRRTTQATNERDIGPSLTDELNAAQRSINAENDASMTDVMTSPDNKMGIANLVNAARTAGGDRVSMQDVMTSPDSGMGIANIAGGVRDFISERDPRKSTMGRTIYDQAKKDLGNLGSMSDFAEGLGLNNLNDMVNSGIQSVKDSDFFSGVPSLEELYPALPEDSSGSYRVGRGINAALSTPYKVLSGFLQPERGMTFADVVPMAQDLGRGILGDEQETRTGTEVEQDQAKGKETASAIETASAGGGDIVEAATTPTSTPSDRSLNSMAGIDDQALATALRAAMQTAEEKRNAALGETEETGSTTPTKKEGGISGLLRDVGSILGRGAGASKGFEFAKIAEEGRKLEAEERLFDREKARDRSRFANEKDLRQMDINARSEELKQRIEAQGNTANAKLTADVVNDIYTGMAFDPLLQAEKDKLRLEATTGSGYFDGKERFDAQMYADAVRRLEDKYIARELARRMGQSGASTASTPTTPATDRFTVVGS